MLASPFPFLFNPGNSVDHGACSNNGDQYPVGPTGGIKAVKCLSDKAQQGRIARQQRRSSARQE
jgi:hypothetical protein